MSTPIFLTSGDPDRPDPENDVVVELTLPQTPSWFGQGENEPVTADQITEAGGEQLAAAAAKLGRTPQALASELAETLPAAIDRLTPSGFTGEKVTSETGNYLLGNGHRSYNPSLMRFTSPDSLSPFGSGGLNAYAYGAGDPVNQADPSSS